MPGIWTSERILALAPDAGAAKAARGLARRREWVALGATADVAWGLCQGSAKEPYQVRVDLGDAANRCTCPSRKLPCKHALGLLLLLNAEPTAFTETTPPEWVATWLTNRARRAEARTNKEARGGDVADPAAQVQRAAEREAKILAGLADLDRWLVDLVRQGLAGAQGQPYRFWDGPAARLVDAQAPGLARQVRELAGIPASGDDWPERLLAQLGRLRLAVAGYSRLATLPPETQADLRTVVGWSHSQDAVLTGEPAVRDTWLVVGQWVSDEDQLRAQRTWLRGRTTGRAALVLAFAPRTMPLDASLVPGTQLDADLVFFPGAVPVRALVRTRHAPPGPGDPPSGYSTVAAALAAYAAALAQQPWLDLFPLLLDAVVPVATGAGWAVRDPAGALLPAALSPDAGWSLRALSGGAPLPVFGEWDGARLRLLAAWGGSGFFRVADE